jgi:hypothetical protein
VRNRFTVDFKSGCKKRNIHRFPEDFMFRIDETESDQLVSQNVIPHKKYFGGSLPVNHSLFTFVGVTIVSAPRHIYGPVVGAGVREGGRWGFLVPAFRGNESDA